MAEEGSKKRILVVDDTEIFRVLMQDLLEKTGYEVLTARDGLEALQTIKHELPNLHLVLLDLLLPKMTGFDVLREIRQGKLGESLPILVITNVFKDAAQIERVKQLGANGYISKDLNASEIVERIQRTLSEGHEESEGSEGPEGSEWKESQ
jgi:chemosensory pili system protein ChpA (sensor histidine kinase/response regulator)